MMDRCDTTLKVKFRIVDSNGNVISEDVELVDVDRLLKVGEKQGEKK